MRVSVGLLKVVSIAVVRTRSIPEPKRLREKLARVTRVGTGIQIEDCGAADFVPLVGRFGWKE